MFPIERRYLLHLAATTTTGDHYTVPWTCEEAVQNLAVWIYSLDQTSSLGAGSAVITRAGVSSSSVSFAGSCIIIPADVVVVGGASDFEILHPQTSNSDGTLGRLQGIFSPGVAMDNSSSTFQSQKSTVKPVSTSVLVTNTDASAKDVVVHWIGLAWRNT